MNRKKRTLSLLLCLVASLATTFAQDKLYPNTFPLRQVKLLDGPFKQACDLNVDVLLQYDTDRLLAPFLKEAGLTPKGESFANWIDLDGHVGGHYLSALAIHYAATGNEECKRRMDYMVSELKRCQQAHGNGYVGGVPKGMEAWKEIQKGNVGIVWKYWVPWYNLHKTYAGLRDAWAYGGSEEAKEMFLSLCDWGLGIIAPLTDEQMEQMLGNEFGGMDEVYADAYRMTDDVKYLDAAKRFSHRWLLDSMAAETDNLDNKHANTQVPKVVGYQRIAELSASAGRSGDADTYRKAADFFWNTVTGKRTLSLGGNSRREHFAAADDCKSYVEDREGPESCNTNNMLKLTEGLFRMSPEARYADFYERAMYNHILSTQHPEHGGYVYFTSARPAHYRVYSAPNSAMWCCVGTGMENHGKYGEFIYSHEGDNLYVNLFVASRLDWKEKGITLTQETAFPDRETSRLTLHMKKAAKARLLIRHPWWSKAGEMKVVCNGKEYAAGSQPSSYIAIERKWKNGDVIEITMPMKVTVEELPNVPEYIAIMRGPILMGARMGTEHLDGLVADNSRWGHIAHGPLVSVFDTPIIIGSKQEIESRLEGMKPVEGKPLCYTVPGLFTDKYRDLQLEPFFRIHDCRYMMYWLSMSQAAYADVQKAMHEAEQRKLLLDRRTVDAVATAEQQPEVDHQLKYEKSQTGYFEGEAWRDARDGGYFQYNLLTNGEKELSLMVRYWGNESANRSFDILIDGALLAEENLVGKWKKAELVNVEYPIPAGMLEGKQSVTVTFRSKPGNIAGGVFHVRLVRNE
ncbi:glycoside hydrolase family 127 protein [uncultured Bacteroides sp.]|uniref:glycoside hydrolase family 127 protein n=1 Tax=uncultured Bacteroides sp. TaxID=162156 RepID=UPI00260AFAD2|nr:glycoside hydrolase family 127 protein [uncultured Bacteroides sp.]